MSHQEISPGALALMSHSLVLSDFLQKLKANPNDHRRFLSDYIVSDLYRLGFVDETDVIAIRQENFSKKAEKLIEILQRKSDPGVVSALRTVLLERPTQKHFAKLLPQEFPRKVDVPVKLLSKKSMVSSKKGSSKASVFSVKELRFVEQPTQPVAYCLLRSAVTLRVRADGDGPLTYQWFMGDEALSGQQTGALETSTAGSYVCEVKSRRDETIRSTPVKVVIVKRLVSQDELPPNKTLQAYYEEKDLIISAPAEITARGQKAEMAYFEALRKDGGTLCRRARLMIVGRDLAGKSSLVNALMGKPCKGESEQLEKSTEGIEFTVVTCALRGEEYEFEKADEVEFLERMRARVVALEIRNPPESKKKSCGNSERPSSSSLQKDYRDDEDDVDDSYQYDANVDSSSDELSRLAFEGRKLSPEMEKLVDEELKKMKEGKDDDTKEPDYIILRISDFAGQPVYLNSHIPFLSEHGVYALVFDSTEDEESKRPAAMYKDSKKVEVEETGSRSNEEYLRTWLTAIGCTQPISYDGKKRPNPSVLMVGTRLDKIYSTSKTLASFASTLEQKQRRIKEYLYESCPHYYDSYVSGVFFVDNTRSLEFGRRELRKVRQSIVKKALKQKQQTTKFLPFSWIEAEIMIIELKNRKYMRVEEFKSHLNERDVVISNCNELLQYFHDISVIVYFSQPEELSHFVVLDPSWLVQIFRSLIDVHTVDERQNEERLRRVSRYGIISFSEIQTNLKEENENVEIIMQMLQKYDFLAPYVTNSRDGAKRLFNGSEFKSEYFIAPALVTFNPNVSLFSLHPELGQKDGSETVFPKPVYFLCDCHLVPEGLYTRLVTRLANRFCVCPEVFRHFSRFHYDERFDVVLANCSAFTDYGARIFLTVADSHYSRDSEDQIAAICKEVFQYVVVGLHDIIQTGMKGLHFSLQYRRSCDSFENVPPYSCHRHKILSCCDTRCLRNALTENRSLNFEPWMSTSFTTTCPDIPICQGAPPREVSLSKITRPSSPHGPQRGNEVVLATSFPGRCEWRQAGTRIQDKLSREMQINSLSDENSGLYTCIEITERSYRATIPFELQCPPPKELDLKLSIGVFEDSKLREDSNRDDPIRYGRPIRLECFTELTSRDLKYQWYFEGLKISGETSHELRIARMRDYLQGAYHCVVSLDDHHKPEETKTVKLRVEDRVTGSIERGLTKRNTQLREFVGKRECADKIALLIGNQKYKNHECLKTPENDVKTISKKLSELFGFHVLTFLDLSHFELVKALEKFYSMVRPGSYVFVFYAGHGFECNNQQYILPIDADKSVSILTAISAESIRQVLEMKSAKAIFFVFDCCRNLVRSKELPAPLLKFGHDLIEVYGYWIIIKTCRSSEKAYEGKDSSSFLPFFLKVLPHCRSKLSDFVAQLKQELQTQKALYIERSDTVSSGIGVDDVSFSHDVSKDERDKNEQIVASMHTFSNTMTQSRHHPEHPVSVTFKTEQTCVNVVKVWCTFEHENGDILDAIVKIKSPIQLLEDDVKQKQEYHWSIRYLLNFLRKPELIFSVWVRYKDKSSMIEEEVFFESKIGGQSSGAFDSMQQPSSILQSSHFTGSESLSH
ncbi:uncharacterized protein [Oscarella lobularis]|uniref:uncharacterized protein isoform X1 n=2 Tax=Oscarella lobularis TaxID=121494 RepID=UPI003313D304